MGIIGRCGPNREFHRHRFAGRNSNKYRQRKNQSILRISSVRITSLKKRRNMSRPNWYSDHPPTCTCRDCQNRRTRRNNLSIPRENPARVDPESEEYKKFEALLNSVLPSDKDNLYDTPSTLDDHGVGCPCTSCSKERYARTVTRPITESPSDESPKVCPTCEDCGEVITKWDGGAVQSEPCPTCSRPTSANKENDEELSVDSQNFLNRLDSADHQTDAERDSWWKRLFRKGNDH